MDLDIDIYSIFMSSTLNIDENIIILIQKQPKTKRISSWISDDQWRQQLTISPDIYVWPTSDTDNNTKTIVITTI